MKSKNRLIAAVLAFTTVLSSLVSVVSAEDSGGHVGIGGSTSSSKYTQASEEQLRAGFSATSQASGVKMSVIRFRYNDKDNNEYRQGALTGKTAIGAVGGYTAEAQDTLGTMPVYFEYRYSRVHPSTEMYVSDEGKLVEFEIGQYKVAETSGIDSKLSDAYSRVYNTLTGLDFNTSMQGADIVNNILRNPDGNVEDMSATDVDYNRSTYRALAYMVMSKYNTSTETYKALKQLYEKGNPVYNGYEYVFLIEPLAALNKQGISGRFYMTPNELGQYYLKDAGYDVRDNVFVLDVSSGWGSSGNVSYIQGTNKWKSENKSNPKTGFGFVFDYVYGYRTTTTSILKKMWFTGYVNKSLNSTRGNRVGRADTSDNMFGWGTLRPLDSVPPTDMKTNADAKISVTVARVGLQDSDVFAYSYTTDGNIVNRLKETVEASTFIDEYTLPGKVVGQTVAEYISMKTGGTIDSVRYLGGQFKDGERRSIQGIVDAKNHLDKNNVIADELDRIIKVEYKTSDNKLGDRYLIDEESLGKYKDTLSDKVIVGVGTTLIDYSNTLTTKYADYALMNRAAEKISEFIKDGSLRTRSINDSKIGYGYKGTNGSRYIKVWDMTASEILDTCMSIVKQERREVLDGLSIGSMYSIDKGVGLYSKLVEKYGPKAVVDGIIGITDEKGSITGANIDSNIVDSDNIMKAGIATQAMYFNDGATYEDMLQSAVAIGVQKIVDAGDLTKNTEEGILDDNTIIKNGTSSSGVVIIEDDAAKLNIIGVEYNKEKKKFEKVEGFDLKDVGRIALNSSSEDYITRIYSNSELELNDKTYTVKNVVVKDQHTDEDKFIERLGTEYTSNKNKLKTTSNANDNNNTVPVITVPEGYTKKDGYMVALGNDGTLTVDDSLTVVFVLTREPKIKVVEIIDSLDPEVPEVRIKEDEEVPDEIKITDIDEAKLIEWFTTKDKTDDVDETSTWNEVDKDYKKDKTGTKDKEFKKDDFKEDTTIFIHYKKQTKLIEVYEDCKGSVMKVDVTNNFELPYIVKNKDYNGTEYKVKEWVVKDGNVGSVSRWDDVGRTGLTTLASGTGEGFVDKVGKSENYITTLAVRYRSDEQSLKVIKIYDINGARAENADIEQKPKGTKQVDIKKNVTKNSTKYDLVEWFVTEDPVDNNVLIMWEQAKEIYTDIKHGTNDGKLDVEKGTVFIKYTSSTVNSVVVYENEKGEFVRSNVATNTRLPMTVTDESTSPRNYKLQEWKIVGKDYKYNDLAYKKWSDIQNSIGNATIIQTGTKGKTIEQGDIGDYHGPITIMVRYRKEKIETPNDIVVNGKFVLAQNEITKKQVLTDFNGNLSTATISIGSFDSEHSDSHGYYDTEYCWSGYDQEYDSRLKKWVDVPCQGHTSYRYCTHYCNIDWSRLYDSDVNAVMSQTATAIAVGTAGSLNSVIKNNTKYIANWEYAGYADKQITPDLDFVIHRGRDKVTLASWVNNIGALTSLGYGVGLKPATRADKSYTTNFGITFRTNGTDLTISRECNADVRRGDCSNDSDYSWSHNSQVYANAYTNSLNYNATEAVNKYTDVAGYGTEESSVVEKNMVVNGYNFKANDMTVTSGGIGNVSYYPYVRMVYQDLAGNWNNAYVLAEHMSTVAFNSTMIVGWSENRGEWLDISSNQFSTHKKAISAHGKDSVIPGGAVMNITGDANKSPRIGMVGWNTYISDDVYSSIQGMDTSINGKNLRGILNEVNNSWEQLKNSALESLQIQMNAQTSDRATSYKDTGFHEVQAGARFNGTTLSNDNKYWLIDGRKKENNSYNISLASGTEQKNKTYYKVRTVKETGELVVEKSSNGTSWSKIAGATAGSWNSILSNSEVAEMNNNTKLVTNMIAAMEQCHGDSGWYTELWDGFCAVKTEYTIGFSLEAPTTRSHVIDVKLTPELASKKDMFNKYFAACYKAVATKQVYTTYKGTKLVLKNFDTVGGSRVFYIPNVTVSDLGNK